MNFEIDSGFETVARQAIECNVCFSNSDLIRSTVDLPQPRWIGSRYWKSDQRVLFLLLNPGSGDGYATEANLQFLSLLHAYKEGCGSLDAVLEHQRRDMPNWGRGRFVEFYLTGLDLKLDAVAFANVAWCGTKENRYPMRMLTRCFEKHTSRLLEVLSPNLVILSGNSVHSFEKRIADLLPGAKVVKALHYANRKGKDVQSTELNRLRELIHG